MKGIIFNLLESFIISKSNEETYEEILDSCNFESNEPFVASKTYEDKDFMELFSKTTSKLKIDPKETLQELGKFCFPLLAQKYPEFLEGHNKAKDFLKTVHSVIHVEVKKMFPEAMLPHFEYEEKSENQLTMIYSSQRGLCPFAQGLIEGTSKYFNNPISMRIEEEICEKEKKFHFHLDFH